MAFLKYYIYIILLITNIKVLCQTNINSHPQEENKNWIFSIGYGAQISGIKPEDFISSNVSPAFVVNIGNCVSPEVAIKIGYKGFYFHTISDNYKHYYNFLFGEVLFNIKELINRKNIANDNWNIIVHPGAGYFYNNSYNQPNICANIGILNSIKVINQLEFFIDLSAIMGWDIYQGDEDIIPSFILGLSYLL